MTRTTPPAIRSLLLAAILLPIGALPGVDATHQADGTGPPEQVSVFPEEPPAETSVDPVDDASQDAADAGRDANAATNGRYGPVRGGFDEAKESATDPTILPLLSDGIEPDGREGGFGDWQVLGHAAWEPRPEAAANGLSGYTQATRADGLYLGKAASLLVSPEVDLATNFAPEDASAAYSLLSSMCEMTAEWLNIADIYADGALSQFASGLSSVCPTYHGLFQQGHPYSFEYSRRFNLAVSDLDGAKGRDGVTVLVFTQEPTSVQDANACLSRPSTRSPGSDLPVTLPGVITDNVSEHIDNPVDCTIVEPNRMPGGFPYDGGYPYAQIESMPSSRSTNLHYPGYSGFSQWKRDTVDLGPWEGQSVWIGFYFTSGAIPSRAYWESPSRFNADADFVGFQLDDVEATAPAAQVNVKARVPTKPDLIPEALQGEDGARPTLPPNAPIPVLADIVNLGTASQGYRAVLRVLAPNGTVARSADGAPYEHWTGEDVTPLAPGEHRGIGHTFPSLPSGEGYSALVCVERTGAGGHEAFCDVPAQPGTCSEDGSDADPCDEVKALMFDVKPFPKLDVGSIQRDADQVSLGDTLSMVLPLANKGNVPLTFAVHANVVDVSNGDPHLRPDMLDSAQRSQTVTLRAGDQVFLNWSMKALGVGQFHLLLDIRDGAGDIDFDPAHDMLPPVLRPWHASSVWGNITVDAVVDERDWLENSVAIDGGPMKDLRVGNTADRLYFAFESPAPTVTVLFGDGNPGGQSGFILGTGADMTRMSPMRFNATSLTWENPIVSMGEVARSPTQTDGRYSYEFSVPLGVGLGGNGIAVKPGESVNVLFRSCTGLQPQDTCAHFPFGAPLRDGDGIVTGAGAGTLDDEVAQWHKIRLADGVPTGAIPLSERILGPGFGVNSVPPPYLLADFSDLGELAFQDEGAAGECPSFHGWTATRSQVDGVTDAWICGAYSDDGRTLLYQGVTPDSECDGGCGDYSAVNGLRTLTTPPFAIPSDAADPTVVLAHQYSTKVRLYDMEREVSARQYTLEGPDRFGNYPHVTAMMKRVVLQDSRLQSFVEVWNETTGAFDAPILLRPDGGYTSEADAGIADPRFDRIFMQEGTSGFPFAADLPDDDTDAPSLWNALVEEARGWWWPQGEQPMHQASDRPFATGGDFMGGSPWTTDAIPLSDTQFGKPLDLRGKTVRLRFEHAMAPTLSAVGDVRLDETYSTLRHDETFGRPVSLVDPAISYFVEAKRPMPLSKVHPFTAVCWVDGDGDGEFTANNRGNVGADNAVLTTNADGCAGTAQGSDLPLTTLKQASGAGTNYRSGHPAGVRLDAVPCGPTAPCPTPNLPGEQYRDFPDGTAFDWVDDGDGAFNWGDLLYLNVGGGDWVEPRDVRISDVSDASSTVPMGAPGIYCGSTKCGLGADTGHVADIVFHDSDMDGQWSPGNATAIDRAYFPSRVFNSGDIISFNRSLDWGWRIGGMAVIEGPRFVRDLAVEDAVLVSGPDALERGVGPGTDVPVRVTVRNLGSNDLGGVFVGLVGEDAQTGEPLCGGPLSPVRRGLGGVVVSGESRNLTLACPVPGSAAGKTLALRATAWREGGGAPEDFLGNNEQRVRGLFPIKPTIDAAVHVGVSPQDATVDTLRTLTLQLENRGNVPLRDVTVHATVAKVTDDGRTTFYDRSWTLFGESGELGLGKTVTLSERAPADPVIRNSDLRFDPQVAGPGRYILVAKVSTPGDADPGNDRSDAPIRALSQLYQNPLEPGDEGLVTTKGVMAGDLAFEGRPGVWTQQPNSHDGTGRLMAGDPRTGEIPVGTDSSVRLPAIDLRTLRDATLSFRHRYDLERGFDAARVEISADGGKTWEPAIPRAQPANGLPDGYPSIPLVGVNAILGDDVEVGSLAYTGRSEDLDGDPEGWITTEIDLTRQPAFFKPSIIDDLVLDGLAGQARKEPLLREAGPSQLPQFTHLDPALKQAGPPFWSMDEPGWFADHRYWWVENRTYSGPFPLDNAGKVWWSGSAGTAGPDEALPRVATRLELDLDPSSWSLAEEEDVVLSWWDWRAGWNDGDQRKGTGGEFHATLLTEAAPLAGLGDLDRDGLSNDAESVHTRSDPQVPELQVDIDETLESGWTRRSILIPSSRLDEVTGVAFTYLSGEADGIGVPLLTPIASGPKDLKMAYHQDDLGWFIDGVQVAAQRANNGATRTLEAYDLGTISQDPTGKAGDWQAVVAGSFPGASVNANTRWSLVNPGAARRDGGWHLEEAEIPGRGTATAWRFGSDDPEGYPAGANSRVVTPLIDLRDQAGEEVSLRFDHKYGFHGGGRAIDAGAVAYQVYDEATGGFGPWRPIGAQVPDDVGFIVRNSRENWRLSDLGSFDAMGYPSMATIPPDSLGGGSSAFTTGFGQDLPASKGFIRTNFGGVASVDGPRFVGDYGPWHPYPFAFAFSGDSADLHPEAEGWDTVTWNVSHLVGQKVRFGFQAWTNPSGEPCSSGSKAEGYAPAFFGTPEGCSEDPRHGWSVANVAVVGRRFQGGLADIRFRVATDGSSSKGEWSLDDIQLSGTRFLENVVPRIAPDNLQGMPGSTVTFDGEVVNLGTAIRPGLALGVSAFRRDTGATVPVKLLTGFDELPDRDGVPDRVHAAYGPFALSPGGTLGSGVPVRASLVLPQTPVGEALEVEVRFEVLDSKCSLVGDECVTAYGFARNEVGGAAASAWTLTSESRLDLRFAPPREDRAGLLVVEPGAPAGGQPIDLAARIANHGTREPDVTVTWEIDRILRKGDHLSQGNMAKERSEEAMEPATRDLGAIPQGSYVNLTLPLEDGLPEGLYRATLNVLQGESPIITRSVEFFVGTARPYYRVDFAQQSADEAGWMDAPLERNPNSMPPESIRFRQVGDQFIWGVSDAQDAAGATYCRQDGMDVCNWPSNSNDPVYGLHGVAESPPTIDLTRVVNGDATLTLRHGFHFENPGDGARLEILPLRTPSDDLAVAAYQCVGMGNPDMWFWIPAQDPSAQGNPILSIDGYTPGNKDDPNTAVPGRINPINEVPTSTGVVRLTEWASSIPAFGGPTGASAQTVRFSLDEKPTPFCPIGSMIPVAYDDKPLSTLLNYTVQLRLQVGTLPGLTWECQSQPAKCKYNPPNGRPGDMGWQIDSLSVSSIDVAVTPENRSLAVFDGHLKQFSFFVTNLGQVEETFAVSFDEAASAGLDASWFDFPRPDITLAPGQTGTFNFGVDVPPGSPPAERRARLVLKSVMDPNVADSIDLDLALEENPLPDLTVQLAGVSVAGNEVEQGTVVQLSATVYNVGLKESDVVPVELYMAREGTQAILDAKAIGRLCPYVTCGEQGSRQTVVFDWQVPEVPGAYTLLAKVDPHGKILEMSKAQNNAALLVNVTRLQRPDVAITDLRFEGLDAQGYALEGDLVTIVANVTNRGRAPATDVPVRIISGTAEILKVKLDDLQPDESRLVTAARLVSRGEVPIVAASAPSGHDVDASNNELRRVLRVRGLDIHVEPPAGPVPVRPGGSGMTSLNVTNDGNVVERVLLRLDPAEKGWGLSVSPNPITVAPGTTASVLVTVVAPAVAVSGLRELSLTATPQSQASAAVPVLLPVRVATSDGAPEMRIGALGNGTLAVRLTGHRNAAENLSLALSDPAWKATPVNVSLGPRGNASVALPVALPPGTPPGAVRVTVQARNATGVLRAEVQGTVVVPRMVAGSLSWAGVVEPRTRDLSLRLIEYRVNVTNTGNVPFVPDLQASNLPDGFAQVDAESDLPSVLPGRSAIASVVLETSAELTAQVHGVLEVQARDPAAAMQDIAGRAGPTARTAVAIGRLAIPALVLPDLEVVRVRMLPIGQVAVGEPVQISVTVRNSGVVRSEATELFAFINGDLVNTYPTMPLEPGAEGVVNLTWAFAERGEHLVYVVADGADAAPELQSDNNGQSLVVEATQSQVSRLVDRDIPAPSVLPLALAALALLALRRRRPGGSE